MEHPRAPEITSELLYALRELMEQLPGGLEYAAMKASRSEEELEAWFARPLAEVPVLEVVAALLITWESLDAAKGELHGFGSGELRRETVLPDEVGETSGKGPLRDFLCQLLKRLAVARIIPRDGTIADARLLADELEQPDQ